MSLAPEAIKFLEDIAKDDSLRRDDPRVHQEFLRLVGCNERVSRDRFVSENRSLAAGIYPTANRRLMRILRFRAIKP